MRKKAILGIVLSAVLVFTAAEAQQPRARAQAVNLTSGAPIEVRLLNEINTETANDGDAFTATLDTLLAVDRYTVLNKSSRVTGRVIKAVSSGRLKRPASLTLELVSAGGYALRTEPLTIDGKSHAGRNTALIAGGAAAGAIIGAIAGGGKGAAIGAAAGAGTGTAAAYMTGKKELVLPVEMPLKFVALGPPTGTAVPAGTPGAPPPGTVVEPPMSTGQREVYVPSPRGRPESYGQRLPVFSTSDRSMIEDYLRNNRSSLPPGLARRDRLPPGLERQVQRNGTLPPGLQKRVQPFPVALDRQLAPLPAGMSRVFLGHRALLLDQGLRIIDMFLVE